MMRLKIIETILVANDSAELQEIYGLYEAQEIRERVYDSKIEQYTLEAASHFNKQVSEDLTLLMTSSPQVSVKSQCSRASRLSAASARKDKQISRRKRRR